MVRRFDPKDAAMLFRYLQNLSSETKQRFGPHPFDQQFITDVLFNDAINTGYIAYDPNASEIVAYSIIRRGFLEHDRNRLQSYGITLDPNSDCTFAPSVADSWQGQGIGQAMIQFILCDLKSIQVKRIILWGGVQCANKRAVNYYLKNGFTILGQFEYNGCNYDMIKEVI